MVGENSVIYRFDGSWNGFMTCVFECYYCREEPIDVSAREDAQAALFPEKEVVADRIKAHRVESGLRKKAGADILQTIRMAFLFGGDNHYLELLQFVRLCFAHGRDAGEMVAEDCVLGVRKKAKAVGFEAHQLTGFVRFAERDGVLASRITPKHFVLPILRTHFCDRYPEERFFIFDATHGFTLFYKPYEWDILPTDEVDMDPGAEDDMRFQNMWKNYYKNIAVEGRENRACRMGHMQKRYWENMTEMWEELGKLPATMEKKKLEATPDRF